MPGRVPKLSTEDKEDIIYKVKVRNYFMTDMAKEYNVGISTIYEVLKNKNTSSKSQKPEESFETLHHIEDSKVIDSHIRQE